ncbi:hypothetical protein, partial [Butyricimonas sp. BSD2780061689_150309_C8]|uniref:hypothetical protein n=1 Tax=Butyricimonas sp. BSD2780061689_150309_C8 TaxID=2787088 RepID=UPI001E5DA528
KWVSFGYKGGSGDFYNSGSSDFIFSNGKRVCYFFVLCVLTTDSSPTNFETKKLKTIKSSFPVIYYLKCQVVKKGDSLYPFL